VRRLLDGLREILGGDRSEGPARREARRLADRASGAAPAARRLLRKKRARERRVAGETPREPLGWSR